MRNWLITKFLEGLEKQKSGAAPGYSTQESITVSTIPESRSSYCHMTKPKLPLNNIVPITLLLSISISRKLARISLSLPKFHRNACDWQNWILNQKLQLQGNLGNVVFRMGLSPPITVWIITLLKMHGTHQHLRLFFKKSYSKGNIKL